MMEAEDVRPP